VGMPRYSIGPKWYTPPSWQSPSRKNQWENYETPSFIRRTKQAPMRKSSHDIS